MADDQYRHGRAYIDLIPGNLYDGLIRQQLSANDLWDTLLPPRKPPTRRQRLARWWDRNLPRVHRGPCNHDDCGDW